MRGEQRKEIAEGTVSEHRSVRKVGSKSERSVIGTKERRDFEAGNGKQMVSALTRLRRERSHLNLYFDNLNEVSFSGVVEAEAR